MVQVLTVSVGVPRLVLLGAGNFDLLETPLWEVDVASPQVAAQNLVLQSERRSKRPDIAVVTGSSVINDLDLPVVLVIADSQIAIARYLLVGLRHRGRDLVGVEVAASLGVDQADVVAIADESGFSLSVIVLITAVGVEEPFVVGVLVVVASNLLLGRAFGITR